MSFKNFFSHYLRGWIPEEPKMPKNRRKKFRMPLVTFIATTTAVSLGFSVFIFIQPLAAAPPPLSVQSKPNSSYVEFVGRLQENNTFIIVLTNGTRIHSENLKLTFLITEKSADECDVQVAVEFDGFCNSVSVEGNIVDGTLVIDSTRSLFLINSNMTKNQNFALTETDDWTLNAYASSRTGHPSTAVDPYGVTALMVWSSQSHPSGLPMHLILGYDPNTGILLYSGYSLSDVLLKKLGIDLLLGGSLQLVSYSENLNLEFYNWDLFWAKVDLSVFFTYFGMALLVTLSVIVVVSVIIRKIRKRRQLRALNTPNLPANTTQNCCKRKVGDCHY